MRLTNLARVLSRFPAFGQVVIVYDACSIPKTDRLVTHRMEKVCRALLNMHRDGSLRAQLVSRIKPRRGSGNQILTLTWGNPRP